MFQNLKKGDIVKTVIQDEDLWATVTGFHNNGGIQARVEIPPESHCKKAGEFIRIEQDDVFAKLEKGPIDDRD